MFMFLNLCLFSKKLYVYVYANIFNTYTVSSKEMFFYVSH